MKNRGTAARGDRTGDGDGVTGREGRVQVENDSHYTGIREPRKQPEMKMDREEGVRDGGSGRGGEKGREVDVQCRKAWLQISQAGGWVLDERGAQGDW